MRMLLGAVMGAGLATALMSVSQVSVMFNQVALVLRQAGM